jgi:hypothetical protein
MPTPLTNAEAYLKLMSGFSIISNGAYTYVVDGEYDHCYYMAYGTYPGCLRGGETPAHTDEHWLNQSWSRVSTIEIIIRNGWFPSEAGNTMADSIRARERAGGHVVPSFEDMISYALDNGTPSHLLKDPMTSGPYWKEYFVMKGLYPAEKDNA